MKSSTLIVSKESRTFKSNNKGQTRIGMISWWLFIFHLLLKSQLKAINFFHTQFYVQRSGSLTQKHNLYTLYESRKILNAHYQPFTNYSQVLVDRSVDRCIINEKKPVKVLIHVTQSFAWLDSKAFWSFKMFDPYRTYKRKGWIPFNQRRI